MNDDGHGDSNLRTTALVASVGKALWEQAVKPPPLLDHGLIAPDDLCPFRYAETAQEAWRHVVTCDAEYGDE